jgi:hypothetical protein
VNIRVAFYDAINFKEKRTIQHKGYISPPNNMLLLARSMSLPKSNSDYCILKKVVGVRGEFDNSVSNIT